MKVLRIPAVIILTLSAAFFPVLFTEDSYASCINTQQAETNATTNPPVAPIEGETVVVTTQVTTTVSPSIGETVVVTWVAMMSLIVLLYHQA